MSEEEKAFLIASIQVRIDDEKEKSKKLERASKSK